MSKNKINITFALFLMFAMTFSLVALPAAPPPYAEAQSTSGTTISQDLINYIYAAPAGNNSRSFAGIGPGVTTPNLMWTAHIPGVNAPSQSTMTAFGGYVFVVNATDTLALDGGTGNVVYTIPNPYGMLGSPMYLGSNYMLIGMNCYTVDTGTLVWSAPPGFLNGGTKLGELIILGGGQGIQSGGGALVTDPEHLPAPMFFCDECGWVLNNPAQPPTVLWNDTGKAQVPTGVGGGLLGTSVGSVYGDGVMVYGSADQTFSGFNATTGAYLWTVPVPSLEFCGTTSISGVFAFGSQDGVMYAWNITTGQPMWTFNPGTPDSSWSWSLGSSYGMIYGHNQDAHFYAVNATTGKLVWSAYSPGNGIAYSGTFSIAGGYIYAQMGENQYRNPFTGQYGHSEFDCFDAYNGTEIWSLPYENGAPQNVQCNAYGNLYLIPTTSSSTPGVYTYSTVSTIVGGVGTLGEVVCIGNGPAQSWSQYMNDATHNSDGWGPIDLTVAWSKPLGNGAPFASSPVFANGIGYIGSTDKNIYAFNASSGNVVWSYTTDAAVHSTPAVVNGYVYTGADDGNVYCLNAATGVSVWKTPMPAGPAINFGFGGYGTDGPPSPMVVGNNLYIGDNNYIYSLSTSSGAIQWEYTWDPTGVTLLLGTPTIVNGIVYIAPDQGGSGANPLAGSAQNSPNGFLYMLDANTGALIKNITIPYVENPFIAAGNPSAYLSGQGIAAPVTVDTDMPNIVFVQQINMRTFAVNTTSGKILWTYDAYYNPGTPGQWGTWNVAGVLYAAGNVYFNEWYSIVAVNALSGNVTWSTWLNRESDAPLSYYSGKIYVDTYFYYVYVLDAATGEKLSSAFCGNEPTQPVPYAGNLYVASGNFNITCYTQATAITASIVGTEMTLRLSSSNVTKGSVVYITGSISSITSPVNATVIIDKPDSTYVTIPVRADANGNFIIDYVPDIAGQLTLSGYWNGDATHTAACSNTVSLTVVEPAPPTPPPISTSLADIYFLPFSIALLIAIIVVGAVLALMLRKR